MTRSERDVHDQQERRKQPHHFLHELLMFVILVLVLWFGVSHRSLRRDLYSLLTGQRSVIYPTLLTLEATLLGFIIAVLAIVLGYAQAPAFRIVRESKQWPALFQSYTRAMRWSACAALASLIGLLIDRDKQPHPVITMICLASMVLSTVFIARMLWVTELVVRVGTAKRERRPGE